MTRSMFSGPKAVQHAAIFFGCLNIINSGMVYGWPSASLPQLLRPKHPAGSQLNSMQSFWVAIAPLLGSILAAPLSCSITDLIGPKRTLIHTFYPYAFSWILIAVSSNFEVLMLSRMVSGISDGCLFSSFSIYVGDICGETTKVKLFSLFPICFSLGILLINVLETISTIPVAASIAAVLTSLSFCGLFIMPESPYYYITKNQSYQAKEAMRWTREREGLDEAYRELQKQQAHKDLTLKEIIQIASGRFLITGIILVSAQQLSGISAFVFFITTILKDTNVKFYFDSEISIVLFSLLLAITICSAFFLESSESKNLLLCSSFGSGFALVVNGLYFQFLNFSNNDSLFALIPVTAFMIYIISYGLGLNNIPFVMLNEIFPRYATAKILGITHVFSSFLAVIVCVVFTLFNDSIRVYLAFYCFAVSSVICFLLILFLVPRTRITCEEAVSLLDSCKEKSQTYDFMHSSFEISDYSE